MGLLTTLGRTVSRRAGRLGVKAAKYAPDILVWAGIGGVTAATISIVRKDEARREIMEEFTEELAGIKEEYGKTGNDGKEAQECPSDASERAYSAEVAKAYIGVVGKLARLYGSSAALYGVSIAAILKSHYILKGRVAGLAAAYECLSKSFDRYRGNVIDRYGPEVDEDCRRGRKKEQVVDIMPDPETGEEITEVNDRTIADIPDKGSEYGRWFECGAAAEFMKNNPVYNMSYVVGVQRTLNYLLQARGHVFLNEAYDALGIPRTPAGAVVGWVYGTGDDPEGDNYIDFGVEERPVWVRDRWRGKGMTLVGYDDFEGFKDGFWLDFNVDGVIYDLI